ncbi:ATP phosphoribosyltransferase regulatory subunit [Desulfurobacterium sp. TC5-1]|uniref:ATP phosphoribosyltransferase regulatory subunit n=1 Tax=Desulfurobacterium sp. TC5-1 TaxID=1158318 RepID=UPI0003B3305A|nr:ATP phosphoribosyltransferase regulatory subunit [Desulfurobacterium sp. TC5-1]
MRETEIPRGFKTHLPKEALEIGHIFKKMEDVAQQWGYLPVVPPTIEYLATFKKIDEQFEELAFKLVDKQTGKLISVRPDFTPQIARIVAASFKNEEPPFRFYYKGNIFRDTKGNREFPQFGFELIGVNDIEADAEVVSIIVDILRNLGLKSFQIDIGHVEFIDGVLEEIKIENDDKMRFIKLLSHKDLSGIEIFMDENNFEEERRKKVEKLLELYGKAEILDTALDIFSNERAKIAVSTLKEMFEILKTYGFEGNIIFDLSERRGMKYHSGITFEIFHPLSGISLGNGGRYDSLVKSFGRNLPATGAAIRIDRIYQLLKRKETLNLQLPCDIYIIDMRKELKKAYEVAKLLRKKGYKVARDIVKRPVEASIDVAFNKGFKYAIVLNPQDESNRVIITGRKFRKVVKEGKTIEETVEKIIESLEEH